MHAMLIGTDFLTSIDHFSDLDFGWGITISAESKHVEFIILHTFQLVRMKLDVVMKQFKFNILVLFLSKIFLAKGNNCCFTHCIQKIRNLSRIRTFTNRIYLNMML